MKKRSLFIIAMFMLLVMVFQTNNVLADQFAKNIVERSRLIIAKVGTDGSWSRGQVKVEFPYLYGRSYSIDGGKYAYGSSVVIKKEGITKVKYEAKYINNMMTLAGGVITVRIDKTKPNLQIQNPVSNGEWANNKITVSATAKDSLSGINTASWQYNIGDGWKKGNKVTVSKEGTTAVKFKVSDKAGNLTEKSTKVNIDKTAPNLQIKNPVSAGTWTNKQVTVSAIAKDDLSGIDKNSLQYNIGDAWKKGNEVTVSEEGTTTVKFRVTDNIGNLTEKSTKVNIDKTIPSMTIDNPITTWVNIDSVIVSASAEDKLCGINIKSWKYNTGDGWKDGSKVEISKEGLTTVKFRVADSAGNHTEKATKVYIDRTNPVISINSIPVWSKQVSVTGHVYDQRYLSELDISTFRYRIDQGDWETWALNEESEDRYSFEIPVYKEGVPVLDFKVSDNAGNCFETSTEAYIDLTEPVINDITITESEFDGKVIKEGEYSSTKTVCVSVYAADCYSRSILNPNDNNISYGYQVTNLQNTYDKANYKSVTDMEFKIDGLIDGNNYLYIRITDTAGNTAEKKIKILVDSVTPSPPFIESLTHPYAYQVRDAVKEKDAVFELTRGIAGLSGSKSFVYSFEKGSEVVIDSMETSSKRIEINDLEDNAEDEFYRLKVWSVSESGRKGEEYGLFTFRIDSSPPEHLTMTSLTHVSESVYYAASQVMVEWNVPLDFTGVKSYYYKLSKDPISKDDKEDSIATDAQSVLADLREISGEGLKTAEVYAALWAEDYAGNIQFDTRKFMYDLVKPELGKIDEEYVTVEKNLDKKEMTFSWGTPTDNTGISRIFVKLVPIGSESEEEFIMVGKEAGSYTWKDIPEDTEYIFTIKVFDTAGNSRMHSLATALNYEITRDIGIPFSASIEGYKIEGNIYLDSSQNNAQLIVPFGMNLRVGGEVPKTIELMNTEFDSDTLVYGHSDIAYVFDSGAFRFTGKGITISEVKGFILDEVTYKLPGTSNDITFFNVKISAAPSFIVLKSDIAKLPEFLYIGLQESNENKTNFTVKGGVSLEKGNIIFHNCVMDSTAMSCKTLIDENYENKLYFSAINATSMGDIKSGTFIRDFVIDMKGNSYYVSKENALLRFEGIVVKEMGFSVDQALNFDLNHVLITMEGIPSQLGGFGFTQNTFGPDGFKLTVNNMKIADGSMIIDARLDTEDGNVYSINNLEFTGGILHKKGIEEHSYVSAEFAEDFYSNLSKVSLKLEEFKVDFIQGKLESTASVEQINGLEIWEYGILNGNLSIKKENGKNTQFGFEGIIKLNGEIPEALMNAVIPVTNCTLGEKAKVEQFEASVTLEDEIVFSDSISITGGVINVSYDEETGPSISCTGNLHFPWMLEAVLGDIGLPVNSLQIGSNGKIDEFRASRSLADGTPYKNGSMFNNTVVVGNLDENGNIIVKMCGELAFTEDFPGGIEDKGIYLEEIKFNTMGRIEVLNSYSEELIDAGFIPNSEMEFSDIVIETNEDGTGINYVVSGQVRLAEIKDIKGLAHFEGMFFDVERLAISDEGHIVDIKAGGSMDGTIDFIGNTVIEDPSVYIIDALSEYEQFNTRIGGKIIIPIQSGEDINSVPPIELNIDRMLLDEEGKPYILDAAVESSGIRPFIGKSYLQDPKISLSWLDGEILTSFQGKVILMGVINEEADLELDINNLVINRNGEIMSLDISGTVPDDMNTVGDFLLREGKIRFIKEGDQTPIIEIGGKILLPEMELESFSRMEINLTRLRFDLDGNLLALCAEQKINSSFKIFDDVKLEGGSVGIQKNSPKDPVVVSVSGTMVLPESAPGAMSGAKVSLSALSFDQSGKILDFGASLDLGPKEKAFIGSSKIRNGFLSIGKPDSSRAAEIELKGTIILPEEAPGAVSKAEVDINRFIMGTDLSIKELDITALEFLEERKLVGGLNSKNVTMSIIKGGGSQIKIKLEGDIILKNGFPEGLKNKVFAINEFMVDSNGRIEKLTINANELDISLYGMLDLKNGCVVIENGKNWNELLFKVGGDLILPKAMPGDLSGRNVHIRSFVISTKDGVTEFKADPLGKATFDLWGGIKAVVEGLELHSDSVSCKGYLQFPSNYPEGLKNLKVNVNRLELGYNGSIKNIDADVDHLKMKLAGFKAEGWNMKVDKNGVSFKRFELEMPANLGKKKIKIIDAGFDKKGNFTGRFENPDLSFEIAGSRLTLKSAKLNYSKNEITFSQAKLKMASELGGKTVTLNGVKLSPKGISFTGGAFKLPSFNISEGVGFKGAKVNFSTEGDNFILKGTSGIMIKNLGTFKGTISLADKSSQYPVGIKRAAFEYTVGGLGVPIGSTGLYINKIRGGFAFGYPSEVPSKVRGMFSGKMRIQMGVSMQDKSRGNIAKGNCDMWIAVEDCTMAFRGNVTVLKGLAKGEMITAISKKGFYGMVKTEMKFTRGSVEIYVFSHKGKTRVSGSGRLDIGIKKGAIINKKIKVGPFKKRIKVPSKTKWIGSVGADFGLFTNGKTGVKGYAKLPVVGKVGVFVSKSSIKIKGVGSYKLYKPSWAQAFGRLYASTEEYIFQPPLENVFRYNFLIPSKDSETSEAGRVVFCLAGIEDPGSIVLVSPDGKRYGITSPNVVASFEEWGIMAALVEPEAGEWNIEISGFENEDEFDIEVLGVLKVPEVSISGVEYGDDKKESLIVSGTTANVEKATEVGIYISESPDIYYGEPAAIGQTDTDGSFKCEVDLRLFDNGKYHVFAVVKGQNDNPDVHAVYDETIDINLTSVKLKPVVNLIAAEKQDGDVGIIFEDINGERTHGFNVYVENTITGEKEVFDLGYITDTYIPRYEDGDVLNITVAPYDVNMLEGKKSLPVTVRVGGIKGRMNVFTLEKDELQVQLVRGEVVQKEIKLINQIPVKTGTALDYADLSVVQAVYDSRGESVIDSVYGITVDFESRYDITRGEPSIKFNVFAEEGIAPGEYILKAAIENIGNRNIRQDMTISVKVVKPDMKVSEVFPEYVDLGDDSVIEIFGSGLSEDTRVFLADKEMNIVERNEDMIVVQIPQNTGYGIKKLKITGDNNQLYEKEIEILEPFYTFTCNRKELYATPGSVVETSFMIKGENGFEQSLLLEAVNFPEGWEIFFDKQTALPGTEVVVSIKIPQGFEYGDYGIKVITDKGAEVSVLVHVREGSTHHLITGYSKKWAQPGDTIKIFGGFFGENCEVFIGDNQLTVLSATRDTIEVLIGDKTPSGEVRVQCGDYSCRGPVFNVISPLSLIVAQGEPDGDDGFYITRPDLEIEYQGQGKILYRINNGNYVEYDERFALEEGVNKIEAEAYDETGTKVLGREWVVRFDKTPPYSSIEGLRGKIDIEKGIHINSVDDISGIKEIRYRIKGENTEWTKWNTYENQINLEYKGLNVIEYYAVDNAGNTEKIKTVKYTVLSSKGNKGDSKDANSNVAELKEEMPAVAPVDIAVSITADKSLYIKGQIITYKIRYKNKSNTKVGEIVVTSDIPEYTSVEDNGGGEVRDGKLVWKISVLEEKSEGQIVYRVKINEFTDSEILVANTAEVESKEALIATQNDKSSINVMLRSDTNGKAIHKGYIKGYPDKTFRPDNEVTRAEIAAMFAKLPGLETEKVTKIAFRDLKPEHWAAESIYIVSESGIFKGYKDNTFMPDAAISRAELAAVIARYLKLEDVEPFGVSYYDIEGHWALNFIEELNRRNIIKGYEDGIFRPDEKVKRSEAVTLINKMLFRGPLNIEKSMFTDVDRSHWAFGHIEEATLEHELKLDDNGNEIYTK